MSDYERQGSARLEYFPRCATCKWAVPNASMVPKEHFPLICTKMACGNFADMRSAPVYEDTLAYAVDTESYYGCRGLMVSPTFGCVMHEAKA